jgi:alpha-mannosidase
MKRSEDEKALILRLHETAGMPSRARLRLRGVKSDISLSFKPFELKTIRVERSGKYREVALQEQRP